MFNQPAEADRPSAPGLARDLTVNLPVADIPEAAGFYRDFLGLTDEGFNLGWVAHRSAPQTGAAVQLVTRDATAPVDSAISVHVADVDAAYAEAQRRGYRIVHPLTHEEWGVRRFFVQAPDGTVVNMVSHAD
ncbi:glyoxalase [Flexivirga caeni]|uniref:Glyoxalase n=2 Tax=Flexivirga caeni TaxID=2294115 RepID=A0A3M9MCT8_9MICO|nr:glyoxalase [Flexivirga caeni]